MLKRLFLTKKIFKLLENFKWILNFYQAKTIPKSFKSNCAPILRISNSMGSLDSSEIPNELQSLSKEELISLLENIKSKTSNKKTSKVKQEQKPFDFQKYPKRHVALKFLYLGWDYSGFAVQVNTEKTIEEQLFKALERTKLVESRETSNYHRCGRTDKGVSAFSQTISLDVRSNLFEGKGIIVPEIFSMKGKRDKEIDYATVLNRVLPPEIRIIAWAPVETNFSARFDCIRRTYKYWFPIGKLDLEKMRLAGKKLVGEHDFRNFCKMDIANGVTNFKRKIFAIDIQCLSSSGSSPYDIAELTVVGQAFLWHQIRCIIHVLFLIGHGKEDCEVVDKLLDVENCPRKPQYHMASEFPLVLFDCAYKDVEWIYDEESLKILVRQLQAIWSQLAIKTVITKRMLEELEATNILKNPVLKQNECLLPGVKPRRYKRLFDRERCESLEERIEHYSKKARIKTEDAVVQNDP